jgi:hypothetical protein
VSKPHGRRYYREYRPDTVIAATSNGTVRHHLTRGYGQRKPAEDVRGAFRRTEGDVAVADYGAAAQPANVDLAPVALAKERNQLADLLYLRCEWRWLSNRGRLRTLEPGSRAAYRARRVTSQMATRRVIIFLCFV